MSDAALPLSSIRFRPFGLHATVMAILALAAAAIGWSLLPGENERIAALERDGQCSPALFDRVKR